MKNGKRWLKKLIKRPAVSNTAHKRAVFDDRCLIHSLTITYGILQGIEGCPDRFDEVKTV